MSDIETYSEDKNISRIKAGFRGGDAFKSPLTHPEMTIVDGSAAVAEKLQQTKVDQPAISDPWVNRR